MSDNITEVINRTPGWVREMGITILAASPDEVTCEWEVSEKHLQAYGIVHGGVHCGIIETLASLGAALVALPRGQRVVGLENNNTSFIRAVRSGVRHGRVAEQLLHRDGVRAARRAQRGLTNYQRLTPLV